MSEERLKGWWSPLGLYSILLILSQGTQRALGNQSISSRKGVCLCPFLKFQSLGILTGPDICLWCVPW